MDAFFWIGQVVCLAILACGAYVSFCFADLADENNARTASKAPDKPRSFAKHLAPGAIRLEMSRK